MIEFALEHYALEASLVDKDIIEAVLAGKRAIAVSIAKAKFCTLGLDSRENCVGELVVCG